MSQSRKRSGLPQALTQESPLSLDSGERQLVGSIDSTTLGRGGCQKSV